MKKFYLNLEQYVSKTVILFWPVLILFTFGNSVFAQTTVNLTTPGSATWTVPCGVTSLTVEAWGGGGAGGGATINPSGGSGGGGGGYSTYIVAVTPGQIINYTVGQGGVGGSGNGGDGGSTTILALTANGGMGGFQDNGTAGLGGTASGGTTNTSGGNGTIGSATAGEAGGNSANGGNGGLAATIESNGNNGTAPGGGGGGGLLLAGAGPSNGGNGGSGQITITYNTPAVLAAPSPVTPSSGISICFGKSTNLNATSSGNTINWYTVPTGGTSIGSSASGIDFPVSPAGNTTYYAEAQSSPGCVSATRTATALVTVNPLPAAPTSVTPNTPQNICNGSNITLNATSAGNTIIWYTVPTGPGNIGTSASGANFTPAAPPNNTTTTYYAEARSPAPASCTSSTRTASGTVTTSALPTINTQPVSPTAVCQGLGTRTISIIATGVNTYQWRRNGVDLTNTAPFSGVNTATLTITNPTTADSGTYTVMLNGSTCGLVSGNATLTVNTLPAAPTAVTPNSPVAACTTAGTTPLRATSAGNTIDWYTQATGGTSIGSSPSGIDLFVSAPTATVYYAESKNAATGCVSSTRIATASVTSNVLPSITTQPAATPSSTVCAGAATVTITVAATGVTTYQWRKNGVNLTNTAPYSGVTTNTLAITNPAVSENGAVFDVVLNNATCPVTSNTITLTVNPTPSAPTSVTPSTPSTICGTANITLNATSAGNTIYWYTVATGGASIGNSTSGANLSVSPTSTVTYYAEARTALGCSSLTRTATATMTINPTPVVTIEFTEQVNDKTYSIAACGHIAQAENDIDIHSGNPAGVNATTFGPTATGQWQVSYDNQATWVNAPGPTSTTPQYLFDPAYSIFETTPGTYYFRLILTVNGCPGTSDVITLTTNGNPTLTPGSIGTDQSSCPTPYTPTILSQVTAATVGTPISGYNFSYQWQSSPNNSTFTNISGATGTTYTPPNLSATTYYRRYAIYGSAGGGCSAVSNTITITVGSLAPPTVGTITQPTCATATGSVVLSGLPTSGTWTLNRSGTSSATTSGTGASTTISLAAGTYTYTVTQSTCTSAATADVVINAQPAVPAIPTASVTAQPTCATPKGTITVTVPAPAGNVTYTLTGISPAVPAVTQAGATFANLNPGSYTVATTNTTSGCTSTNTNLTVNGVPPTPAPTISNTAASCSAAGTSTVSNYNAGFTYAFTPAGPTVGAGGLISGMTIGTSYTVKATNGSCTQSVASASFSIAAQLPTPAIPTINSTAATCSAAGTSTISNYAAGNSYTFTPTGPTVAAGGAISSMTVGTSYTVTATSGGCTSAASASFSNAAQLPTPAVPTISSTAASCSADGTSTISNYSAGNTYTFTPAGPSAGAGGAISGMTLGTSYTVTASSGGCTSVASASFSNAAQLPTPAVPTLSNTAASCSADGTSTISNYNAGNTYTFTPAGPSAGAGGAISGMTLGTSYTVTASSGGCTSAASASFSNAAQLPTPAVPTISSTAASCSADGTSTISNYNAGNTYTFTPAGPSAGAGGSISGMTLGTSYTVTATSGGCTSAASASFSNAAQLPTPAVPTLSSTAASCSANGTSTISNYNAGNTYAFTPAGPSAGAGGAISGMTLGTSYTVTASSGGCTSAASASFSNAAQLPTPAVPTLSTTAASCSADGTSTISNYNAGYTYTFTPAGPSAGAGGAISGMTLGTSYTVTASSGGCTSAASASFSNAAQLPTPAVPTLSNTAASCSADGTSTISNYNAGNTYAFTPAGPTVGAGGAISGMTVGTSYTVTASSGGCTSAASASFSNAAQLPTPAIPTLSSTAASCSADGTSSISNYNAGNTYAFTPAGPSVGAGGAISGMTVGTSYTVTASSGGCTSAASASFSNAAQLPTPTVPTLSNTAASCSADGTSTISNYNAGNTYTFTPAGPSAGAGGAISGMTLGTSYTVTASSGGCTSTASASFSNAAQLTTPAVPTLSSTAASCSADGTSTISNYNAGNTYTFTPAGPSAGAGGAISGMTLGTSYTVTASSGGCTSTASASFSNAAQLTTPAVPTLSSTAASCSADGTSTISNYNAGNTYAFTPAGPSAGAGGAISGMTLGTSYTVTASSGGCTSAASASFSNAAQLPTPAVPILTAGTVNCNDVTANWTTIPNVTGYRIDVARDNIFTDIIPAYNNLLLGSGVVTENVTGLASGLTFYIRVRAENSCGTSANSTTLTLTTGASPTAFTATLVQPNCVTATGQITINESVVDPSDQYSFDDGATYQSSNVKDLLAAGTYKVRVKNTNGCETLATTVVLNAAAVTTYSGSWSNGVPDVLKKAIFASNYTFSGDIQACSCEVDTGVTVTVNPGFSLVLENGIDVLGSGSLIFENNSSLIQTNNVVNTGNITYKRNTTPVGKFDYTYWSSPVYPQTLLNVSPTTLFDKYLSWDAVGGKWKVEATGTVMEKGTGYIIRGPQANATPAVHTASFIGVPNNGTISVSIAGSGLSYLLGNPYPSALDADEFLGANPALDGTIRFWTHNTPVTNLKYNGNDYASYNAVGGTGTAAANTGVNNSIPTGKIAAGQAFFATSNAAGTVTFENTMRVGPGGTILNNSQFFKGPKPKTSSALKKHRVWLNLSNTDGAFKQLLLGYVTNATNGLDRLFDGQTLNANKYVDFYSINESKKLSIQGRALPFDVMDQVLLGFKTTIEGTFSINIEQTDGVLASLPIFLEDKLTGTIVNLKNGAYSFSTAIGTFDDRFVLRYIDSSIKISDYANILDEINKKVLVSVKNHHIKINSFDQTIENVTIYDLSRRKLYEKDNINSNEFNVPDFSSTNQFLMVQIRLKNGKIVTDKIIY